MMDKEPVKNSNGGSHYRERVAVGGGASGADAPPPPAYRSSPEAKAAPDFVLQWGNRKRLRCMKIQVRDESATVHKTTVRVDRRVVRGDPKDSSPAPNPNQPSTASNGNGNGHFNLRHRPSSPAQAAAAAPGIGNANGYFNLRHRPSSPARVPPPPQRVLRNSEAMRGQSNGVVKGFSSPSGGGGEDHHHNHHQHHQRAHDRKAFNHHHNNINHHHHHHHHGDVNNNGGGASNSTDSPAHDSRNHHITNNSSNHHYNNHNKGGSSSGGSDAMPAVWPPKFVIALTNKEKEEDFMAIKGSKLPQRPKKRAKFVQRTLNLVSPGAWLCDLTLERYEVREKKISKKRPRGLKAMGNMDSDSE